METINKKFIVITIIVMFLFNLVIISGEVNLSDPDNISFFTSNKNVSYDSRLPEALKIYNKINVFIKFKDNYSTVQVQEEIISFLSKEFKVNHKFESSSLSGDITLQGFNILINDSKVKSVVVVAEIRGSNLSYVDEKQYFDRIDPKNLLLVFGSLAFITLIFILKILIKKDK